MRLAYVSTDPGISVGGTKGASVHLGELVGALAEEGTEVGVFVAAVTPGALIPRGVTVEVLPGPLKTASVAERVDAQPALAAWLAQRLEPYAPDALYERLALYAGAGASAAQALRVPFLVELNAPLLEEAARYRTLDDPATAARLEADTLSAADVVFAVSRPLVDYAVRRGARRVEVLQNAAAIDKFPLPARGDGDPVAVFAGTLRPWHGLDTIAAAWRILGSAAPQLLVVGDGPSRRLLDGVSVRSLGEVPAADVPAVLATADIGLAPYGRDTPRYFSPIKLFEYLAAGLATVVGDLPAVTEVVDEESAVVIPAGDADALARAVSALCADPARRRRLGENGRELVRSRHTWRHRARRVRDEVMELSRASERA